MLTRASDIASAAARWAIRRLAPLARYEGATHTARRSYLPGMVQSARLDLTCEDRTELVRKARYWERNSPLVNRLASIWEAYTVGDGLSVQPASSDPAWNMAARDAWEAWGQFADLSSLQAWPTLQSLIARAWWVDGEVFVHKTRGESGRPRIQLIESHLVRTPSGMFRDRSVCDGIQFDGNGRPVGYWVTEEDTQGNERASRFVDAGNIIHVFEPDRPGQIRGLPFVTPALNILHDIDDLGLLEMQAARDAAAVTNVVKNDAGELSAADVRRLAYTQTTELKSGSSATETRYQAYADITGARTIALKTNESLEQFRSERPSVVTMDYWRHLKSEVCTAVGIPYVLAYPDSMQGTVFRGALDMAAAYFRARSLVMASVCADLFAYVIGFERLLVPSLRNLPSDWRRVNVMPPRAPNVDVGRNATAMRTELEIGATTFDEIYGAKGKDWRERFDRLAEQVAYAKEKGIPLSVLGLGIQPTTNLPQNQPSDPNAQPIPA